MPERQRTNADGTVKLTGKDAHFARMMLDASVAYDLSHFWVSKHSKAIMMPPGTNICTTLPQYQDMEAYKLLHKKCGGSAEHPIMAEVTQMAAGLFEVMTGTGCYVREHSHQSLKDMKRYLTKEADAETKEFLMPRVKQLTKIFATNKASGLSMERKGSLEHLQRLQAQAGPNSR